MENQSLTWIQSACSCFVAKAHLNLSCGVHRRACHAPRAHFEFLPGIQFEALMPHLAITIQQVTGVPKCIFCLSILLNICDLCWPPVLRGIGVSSMCMLSMCCT